MFVVFMIQEDTMPTTRTSGVCTLLAHMDPSLKAALFSELARVGMTYKAWLTDTAKEYVNNRRLSRGEKPWQGGE